MTSGGYASTGRNLKSTRVANDVLSKASADTWITAPLSCRCLTTGGVDFGWDHAIGQTNSSIPMASKRTPISAQPRGVPTSTGSRTAGKQRGGTLVFSRGPFSGETVRAIIDDWFVPALMDELFYGPGVLLDPAREEDNENQS